MTSTPPEASGPDQQVGAPIPAGYKAGDYVPFADRDPSNPSSIAGQWADPARQAQMHGQQSGRPLTPQEQYRAIYGMDAPTRVEYASWGRRALGWLIDSFLSGVVGVPLYLGWSSYGEGRSTGTGQLSGTTLGLLAFGGLIALAFFLYNQVIRQGRTGYTLGKTAVGIKLVGYTTGEPIGAGIAFVRQLAHYVDSLLCYLGWLWPLWDGRNQTLADKMCGTVVIIEPDPSGR
jgi:uncharacterized RDD family membrane protein YckC